MGVDYQNNRMIFTGDSANQPVSLWFVQILSPSILHTSVHSLTQHPAPAPTSLPLTPPSPKPHPNPIRTISHRNPNRRCASAETILSNKNHNRNTRFRQPEDRNGSSKRYACCFGVLLSEDLGDGRAGGVCLEEMFGMWRGMIR